MSVDSSAALSNIYRLIDYKPTPYAITKIELEIDLDESSTYVRSKLFIEARQGIDPAMTPLVLQGVDLELLEVKIDQIPLNPSQYTKTDKALLLATPSKKFSVETYCLIHPNKNFALEGLYQSGQILCTQCEAEGFRRITYFLDRPDVMAIWKVTLRADKTRFPLLLANGNLESTRELENNRHETIWYDPWPKPSYLFAVAGGNLFCIEDRYTSCLSSKSFGLKIYCERHNSHRLHFAMQSLKRSMLWDETHYGREYDLDVFHIVAVDSFNMGAMENKGLNIFNAQCLLADPNSTTDDEFRRIEAIIAHEYFHNWTGNRITSRDWFQLTLKEGLTVFRDHQFSADHHSAGVVRLEQVQTLVLRQMVEDASALAHPIQPIAYEDINNFYTLTVYEKGAEIIRMLFIMFGAEAYRKALDYYFDHFDGTAATTEDFIHSFEAALDVDLKSFRRWYNHYRTPKVIFSRSNGALKLKQEPTLCVEGPAKPLLIPLKTAYFDSQSGKKLLETLIILDTWEKEIELPVDANSLVSMNRGLSAPVLVIGDHTEEENQKLACFDDDPVSRWMLCRSLLSNLSRQAQPEFSSWIKIVESCFQQESMDNHTKALLTLAPSPEHWLELVENYDIDKALLLHKQLVLETSKALAPLFKKTYQELHEKAAKDSSPQAAAARHLKAVCMDYLIWEDEEAFSLLWQQMESAKDMSDRCHAFKLLCRLDNPYREKAIDLYKKLHQGDNLTWPKWISVQAASLAEDTLERVRKMAQDESVCNKKVPNQIRALVAQFTNNPGFFHKVDGSGYAWVMEMLEEIDTFNPQTAAKLAKAFAIAPRLPQSYQTTMLRYIQQTLGKPLSVSLKEVLKHSLGKHQK